MNELTQTTINEAAKLQRELVGSMNTTIEKAIAIGGKLVQIKKDKSTSIMTAYDSIGIDKRRGQVYQNCFHNRERYELGMGIEVLSKKSDVTSFIIPTANKPIPTGKYEVIYADPPWKYDFAETSSRKIENQYPTMTIDQLCDLKVPAADDAVLYMWATAPKLSQAMELISAWGFEYKTNAVWDKEKIGMGYWFRGQHEMLLVATKGKFSPPEAKLRTSSVINHKRGKHSAKPHIVYKWIEMWFENHSKIELFARNTRKGWANWGNEQLS